MRLIDADALVDALMTYTWRDEDDRLIDDADEKRAYIEQWLPNLPTVSGWVSVNDRLPDETEDVIICYEWVGFSGTKYREVTVNDLREVKQISDRIIAWMPLPEEPKEDEE